METYQLDEYLGMVKDKRTELFPTPYDLVYKCFTDLAFDQKDPSFFIENASLVVEQMREKCWSEFLPIEEGFTSLMLRELISTNNYESMGSVEAITSFVETYPKHIYQLSLSNTQSRRSRAGKEFEAIIELLLIGAAIPMDAQGNIGKQAFVDKGLGKLVDVVCPGAVEFVIDKNDVTLISAKTTLRERWQEVPEEMGRTGASSMYLATLDDSVTNEVLETLYEANIRLTTTKSNKEAHYRDNRRVITFEQLLSKCKADADAWNQNRYSDEEKDERKASVERQKTKHNDHPFVAKYYDKWLENLTK